MSRDLLLMYENTEVLLVNFDDDVFEVKNKDLLPFGLKRKLRKVPELSKDNIKEVLTIMRKNNEAFTDWLANRTLSLSRKNAKWIYNLLKIDQLNTPKIRAKVALTCRAVSVLDNYWLKLDGDKTTWSDINVRHVSLNEVIAQVALHGKSLTLQGSLCSPELTTNGAYAKAWRRFPDGLHLFKLGHDGNTESRIEVMCSNLLDKMNVEHCHYEAGEDEGKYVCVCPAMTTDKISILPGMDFISYCNVNGKQWEKELLELDSDNYYKMWIVDFLLANRDRHGQNWGLWYKPDTMQLVGLHPLFDHNNAFDKDWLEDRNATYQMNDKSIMESAKFAMSKVDFHFTEEITRDDFITKRQYDEFKKRAEILGIKTLCNYEDKVRTRLSQLHVNLPLKEVMKLLPSVELKGDALDNALIEIRRLNS